MNSVLGAHTGEDENDHRHDGPPLGDLAGVEANGRGAGHADRGLLLSCKDMNAASAWGRAHAAAAFK